MNYYERHIGDYMKDAGHLSLVEHGVYMRLMDAYYSREAPIPQDQAYRLVGAKGRNETAAVDAVLVEFFKLTDGVWRQKRCDEVIAAHAVFIASQRAKAALRWLKSGNAEDMPEHMPRDELGIDPAIPPTSHLPSMKIDTSGNGSKKPKSGKIPLPDDFTLTAELAAYAQEQLPDADVTRLFANFTTDAGAKGWKYASWPKAWQGYCRNARKDSGHFAAGVYPKTSSGQSISRANGWT